MASPPATADSSPEPAPRQRPPVSTPPERPQVSAPPERQPDRAPTIPKEFFWGGSRAPAVEARAGAAATEAVLPCPPESQDPPWPPESPDPPWPPESPDPPWTPESPDLPWQPELPAPPWVPERAPPWRPSVKSPCSLRPPEHPPPPPHWMLHAFRRGGILSGIHHGHIHLRHHSHQLRHPDIAILNCSQTPYAPTCVYLPFGLLSFVPLFSSEVSLVPGSRSPTILQRQTTHQHSAKTH